MLYVSSNNYFTGNENLLQLSSTSTDHLDLTTAVHAFYPVL